MTVSAHSHEDSDHAAEEHNHETYDTEQQEEIEKQYEEYDEHVWTHPQNAIRICESIAKTLCDIDHAHADMYESNLAVYTDKLCELDRGNGFRSRKKHPDIW